MKNSMEKTKILEMLNAIDKNMDSKHEICLIGSSVLIILDMPLRYTMDLDIWNVHDKKNVSGFKNSVLNSGFLFDPNEYEDLNEPYVQIVNHDFVHMPINDDWYKDIDILWQGKNLTVFKPPLEIIAASKLAAGRDQDFDDVDYLFTLDKDLNKKIEKIAKSFSIEDQEIIKDNLIIVELSKGNFTNNQNKKRNTI